MDSKSDRLLEEKNTKFENFAYHCTKTFNAYILDNFLENQQQIKDLITSKQNTLSLNNIVMKASKRESKRKNRLDKLSFKKNEITKSINNINIDLSQQVEIERFSSCINKQIILCQQHLKDLIKQVKLISPNSETDSDEEIEKFTDFLSDTESSETAKFLNENKILKKLKELEKISKFKNITKRFKKISTINKSEKDYAKSFSETEQENMFWFKDFLMKKPLKDTTTPEPVQEIDTIIISDDDNSNEKSESINNNEINDQEDTE